MSLLGPQELLDHGVDGVRLLLLHPVRRSLQQPQRVVRHVLARPREGALYELIELAQQILRHDLLVDGNGVSI